ncbi:hypothetical protein ASPWEDRAFT_175000 [Aspergillus wentii DTO 134E9]|uniref:Phytochrome n=1 Tax=Aspergillus wentii DTO 134E9 TaxID=1073089 RepID=A0A1L9RF89_ASPWE|nr:uncharacterized protein ASPWEDRAFT_175000 [Aspergillus wentii DTO 134E9]KAI9926270.1 Light-sensor Protein kinase [Aspergillus wentii]OJJ33599.1 hypothetical protein ASPWEDRAFT_175000 [Aspergillus wentii DTO 134E9]
MPNRDSTPHESPPDDHATPDQSDLNRDSSFDGTDRVYPIRSVISADPSISVPSSDPQTPTVPLSPTREGAREYSIIDAETWNRMRSNSKPEGRPISDLDKASQPSPGGSPKPYSPKSNDGRLRSSSFAQKDSGGNHMSGQQPTGGDESRDLVTTRFQHIVTDGGHAVITGRDRNGFKSCEDEPIRIPGAVQSFGALVAFREESDGKLVVRVVSENSTAIIGYSPKDLFALDSFCDILKDDQADTLLDHVDFIRDDADPGVDGPEVFILSVKPPKGSSRKFWCAIHSVPGDSDMIVCEFEPEDDRVNPLNVSGQTTPTAPADTLGIQPTPEQMAGSTINISQPLRVLRNARRRRGEAAAMEVFSILTQIQDQMARAETLDSLLNITAGLVKELTGFHRVLIYQFDTNWNGMVVAELLDPRTTKDVYKGLHFPASDIPKQARDLYRINKVRLLYDRDQVTSRLVCRTVEDLETPLDMTHAYLRAMSPIHVKYLANMAVRASMSISINGFNELWGLISCHSYGQAGMRVSFPIRKMCRLIGDTVSRNIERLSYASRLQARKLINTVPTDANPSGYIIASSDDLLKLFDADYGALSIRDETKILGKPIHSQEVLALVEYLRMREINSVLASHNVAKDFPDLRYPPGFKSISGILYVPLSAGGTDFIVFFRRGQLTEIKWAGNPYEKKFTQGNLEPRRSFETWRETVLDQSREWTESDVETAAVLCLVYGKFIKVWRQKEAAMQSSQLTKLLLANSAHEVRTPLNAIVNYLEIALEGALDNETRDNLTKSYSASKSLIYVINDLLDLTNAEKGQNLIKDECFDLPVTFKEATDMFEGEAKRKNVDFTAEIHPGVPNTVIGDQRRVRQVISNLISNAIQHTSTGKIAVQMWRSPIQPDSENVEIQITVLDTGSGMSQGTLEALFQGLEQVSTEDESHNFVDPEDQSSLPALTDGQERQVLGLGLALVARIVRNMHGQLSVRSEEGKGSRFKISLRFPVPDNVGPLESEESRPVDLNTGPVNPLPKQSEFMLVDGNQKRRSHDGRRQSNESNRSGNSFNSSRSGRSEADRLISAMQEGPLITRSTSEGSDIRRLNQGSPNSTASDKPSKSSIFSTLARTQSTLSQHGTQGFAASQPIRSSVPLMSPAAPGQAPVTDSGVPVSAVRIPEQAVERPTSPTRQAVENQASPPVLPPSSQQLPNEESQPSPPGTSSKISDTLRVLVAEDDPINGKIVQKRLGKLGHSVCLTKNGEECAGAYRADCNSYDVVLMDIQMPIVDGMGSTKMIRDFEQELPDGSLSEIAKMHGRVPIFAVSASLFEKDAQKYIDTGFDGWIMKPIDFNRLNVLLDGLQLEDVRRSTNYQAGSWEKGGWFVREKA